MNEPSTHGIQIEISPHDEHELLQRQLRDRLLIHPAIREQLGGDLRVVSVEVLDKDVTDSSSFRAIVHDRDSCRTVAVRGTVGGSDRLDIRPTAHRPLPTREEYAAAVEAVLHDDQLADLIERGGMQSYQPMPPYADIEHPDGTVDRVVTVGLRAADGDVRHRIVGVRLRDLAVIHEPIGVPHPAPYDCEPTPPAGGCQPTPGRNQARVRVIHGATTLWDFIVVRPSASSGTNGSGVELRYVDYLGRRVLYQAHVPILNVQYGAAGAGAGCWPTYRDWQNQETCFTAVGTDPVGPGFRVCSQPPESILDSGHDGGNFSGVAFYYRNGELRIVSQLSAGWYRYISDWRLTDGGTIKPRFGFAATANPCTCKVHTHHAYWRLDFDILTPGNNVVEEYNDPPIVGNQHWHTKLYEIRRPRDPGHKRRWRVRNKSGLAGYTIQPGPNDGTADNYGAGDVWVLRYHPGEIDDGHPFSTNPAVSRADIDKFLTAEPVDGQDVVIWYGGHFVHDEAHPSVGGHIVGPDLNPFNWA